MEGKAWTVKGFGNAQYGTFPVQADHKRYDIKLEPRRYGDWVGGDLLIEDVSGCAVLLTEEFDEVPVESNILVGFVNDGTC